MIVILRGLARLMSFLLLVALAVAGAAAAVGSISSEGSASLPGLAELLDLGRLERETGGLLEQLERPGPVALMTLLAGLGAVAVGLLLLVGLLWPRRERLFVLARDENGTLATRRRTLRQIVTALADGAEDCETRRVRVRPRRRGRPGGRIRVRLEAAPQDVERRTLRERAEQSLAPVTEYGVKTKVSVRRRRRR